MHTSPPVAAAGALISRFGERMSVAEAMPQVQTPETHERWLFHTAWILGAAVFLFIGALAVQPMDPQGPVSLLAHEHRTSMALEVLALAVVVSGLATALAGRSHPEIGAFAVCIGLAAVSVRGSTMTYLLMRHGDTSLVCWLLAGEALFWTLTVASASAISGLMVRWFGVAIASDLKTRSEWAVAAFPWLGRVLLGRDVDQQRDLLSVGLRHIAVATIVALLLIALLSSGSGDRAIQHGQACFAVAAGTYLAVNRAQVYFPVRSMFWSMCAVPAVCLVAYTYAWIRAQPSLLVHGLATVPVSNYLRILPITYVTVGVAAALLARWRWHGRHESAAPDHR
jgi:hypothetical protein